MKKCIVCGKEITKRKNNFYCSMNCKISHMQSNSDKHTMQKCKYCGKYFEKGKRDTQYCSRECYIEAMKSNRKRNCENCGKEFIIPAGAKQDRKFCSKKCSSQFRVNKINIICPVCGKKFTRTPSTIKKINCCSISCANIYKTARNKSKKQLLVTELFETLLKEKAESEAYFSDLKDKGYLFVDAIFYKNRIALEYNGPHHYKQIYKWKSLEDQIKKDSIKKKYFFKKGYTFIEWPYDVEINKDNVKNILMLISSQAQPSYINVAEKVQRLEDEVVTANNSSTSASHLI